MRNIYLLTLKFTSRRFNGRKPDEVITECSFPIFTPVRAELGGYYLKTSKSKNRYHLTIFV